MKVEDVHLVFVHGWLSDKRLWHQVISQITNPVSAVNFELQGFGETANLLQVCVAEDISPAHQARQLFDNLKMFNLQKADESESEKPIVFVSHSRGGIIVQQFLMDYGHLFHCKGWIAVGSNVGHITPATWWTVTADILSVPAVSELVSLVPNVVFVLWLRLLLYIETRDLSQADTMFSWLTQNDAILEYGISRCLIKQLKAFTLHKQQRGNLDDILPQIDKRLWMICGSGDIFYPLQNAKSVLEIAKLKGMTEKMKLICIENGPHFLPLTNSKQIAHIIDDFLTEIVANNNH